MLPLVTPKQMRELDRLAIEELGTPGVKLMENAGRAVVDCLEDELGPVRGKRVAVISGKGNNGGDGFVAARLLRNRGAAVSCLLLGRVTELKAEAQASARLLLETGAEILEMPDLGALTTEVRSADVVVDAMFGTGLSGAPTGICAQAVELMNGSDAFTVSIDVPSGLDAGTGAILEPAVRADLTVSMVLPKYGHVLFPGCDCVGKLRIADIGIPRQGPGAKADTFLLEETDVRDLLPPRPRSGHKGTFGTTLLVAGARGFTGAACLAGAAAVRSGCGLVKLAIPKGVADVVESRIAEAVKIPLAQTDAETPALAALGVLLENAATARSVAIGPGITTHPETAELVRALLPRLSCPVVVDADAINCLADDPELLTRLNTAVVLTPHPGELSRLTKLSPQKVNSNRIDLSRAFVQGKNIVLVLKGAPTVVAAPDNRVFVNSTGNSGLGSGGTGDVLTGLLAGILAQGTEPSAAAAAAVLLHGLAADLAAAELTEYCLSASDVIDYLPRAFRSALRKPGSEA